MLFLLAAATDPSLPGGYPGLGAFGLAWGLAMWVIYDQRQTIKQQREEIAKSNEVGLGLLEQTLPALTHASDVIERLTWEGHREHPHGPGA